MMSCSRVTACSTHFRAETTREAEPHLSNPQPQSERHPIILELEVVNRLLRIREPVPVVVEARVIVREPDPIFRLREDLRVFVAALRQGLFLLRVPYPREGHTYVLAWPPVPSVKEGDKGPINCR